MLTLEASKHFSVSPTKNYPSLDGPRIHQYTYAAVYKEAGAVQSKFFKIFSEQERGNERSFYIQRRFSPRIGR